MRAGWNIRVRLGRGSAGVDGVHLPRWLGYAHVSGGAARATLPLGGVLLQDHLPLASPQQALPDVRCFLTDLHDASNGSPGLVLLSDRAKGEE